MAKGSRASSVKANNVRLKNKVFGPVEAARNERLSAKLLELAAQPKPSRTTEEFIGLDGEADEADARGRAGAPSEKISDKDAMDVDGGAGKAQKLSKSKIEKRKIAKRKSSIVFPKFKDGAKRTKTRTPKTRK